MPDQDKRPGAEWKRPLAPLLAVLIVAAVAIGCYWNTLDHGFVNWDDSKLILENKHVRGATLENLLYIWTRPIDETYLPLRATSYAVDYSLWGGYEPRGFHLTNILLHAAVSLLVFAGARRVTGSAAAALFAGILFAVHPVHTEPVAWASGRKDLLSTALLLGAYLLYLRARGLPRMQTPAGEGPVAKPVQLRLGLLALSVALFFLSGLAKAMVVTLPVFLVMTDFVFGAGLGGGRWRKLVPAWALYFAAAGVLTWIAMHFASSVGAIRPWHFGGAGRTALFMTWAAVYYVKTMLWPDLLSARYPYGDTADFGVPQWQVHAAPVVLVVVAAAVVWFFWRARGGARRPMPGWGRFTAFGFAWFFVGLLPVMNIVPIIVLVADRYLYLPSVGWAFAGGGLFWLVWGARRGVCYPKARRMAAGVLFVVLAAACALRSVERNRVWQESLSLWRSVVSEFPESSPARRLLASAYAGLSPPDEERAFEELDVAEELDPFSGQANYVRAKLYVMLGQREKALDEFALALYKMGEAEEQKGNLSDAAGYYMRALQARPDYEPVLLALAKLEIEAGRSDEARAVLKRVLDADPGNLEAAALLLRIDRAHEGDK